MLVFAYNYLRVLGFSYRMTDDTIFSNWQSKRDYCDNQVTLQIESEEIQKDSSS